MKNQSETSKMMNEVIRTAPRKSKSKPWRFILLAAALLGGIYYFTSRGNFGGESKTTAAVAPASGNIGQASNAVNAPSDSTAKASLTVTTALPVTANMAQSLQANGNIMAWQDASVGAQANGLRLASVKVNVGENVTKGQVLATFDTEAVKSELQLAQANYDGAKSELDRARKVHKRIPGAVAEQELERLSTQEKVMTAQLKSAQIRSDNTTVIAPDSGVISARTATQGAVVAAGQELFRMIRQGRLEWRGEVTPREVGRVQPGASVEVMSESGVKVNGTVRAIAPSVDTQSHNILIYVDLPPNAALKAGTFAKGNIGLGLPTNALTVPSQSVVVRDGFSYAFVVDANNKVQQRRVTTGRRADAAVEILEGLQATDHVAVQGAGFLNDGDVVKVVQ